MDLNLKPTFDDSEIISGWQSFIEHAQDSEKAYEDFQKTVQNAGKSVGKELADTNDKAAASTKKYVAEVKNANKELAGAAKSNGIFSKTLNAVDQRVKGLQGNLGGLIGTKGLGGLATKLGIIGLVFGTFTKAIGRSQKALDFISRVTAGFNEGLNTVLDTIVDVGDGLLKFATAAFRATRLDFEGAAKAFEEGKDAFVDAGNEIIGIADDVADAYNLEGAAQALRDNQIRLRREIAESRAEIKRLNKDAEDTTKTFQERERAADQAGILERSNLTKRLELENENIRIIKERQALGKNLAADDEQLTQAIESRAALQQESLELQTTIQNKLNTIRQERIRLIEAEQKRIEDLTAKYVDLLKNVESQITNIDLSNADPITRLNKEREIAVAALGEQRDELVKIANDLGKPIGNIEDRFAELIAKTIEQFEIAKREIETRALDNLEFRPVLDANLGLLSEDVKTLTREVINVFTGEITDITERINEPIPLTLNFDEIETDSLREKVETALEGVITDEDFQKGLELAEALFGDDFADGVNTALQSILTLIDDSGIADKIAASFNIAETILNVLSSGTATEIEQLEQLQNARSETIQKLESDLEQEKELKDLGLANNFESTQQSLEQERTLREENAEQILELKKRQIKQETAANLAAQASEFSLAIAKVFAAHSGIPFVGIALAGGFIASMIATIKSSNDQIKALNTTSLYTGGSLGDHLGGKSSGFVKYGGRSDKPGASQGGGYRVYDPVTGSDVGLELGGMEYVNKEDVSQEHAQFLGDLNLGKYKGVNLTKVLANASLKSNTLPTAAAIHVTDNSVEIGQLKGELASMNSKLDKLIKTIEDDTTPVVHNNKIINVKKKKFKTTGSVISGSRDL